MRNNNWYIAEDGTIRSKTGGNDTADNRNENLYVADDGTIRTRDSRDNTGNAAARPETHLSYWGRANALSRVVIILEMAVCILGIVSFASVKTFFAVIESSLFLNIAMWLLPVALFIVCAAFFLDEDDNIMPEWMGASVAALFGQIILWQLKAEAVGQVLGFLGMLLAAICLAAWIVDQYEENLTAVLFMVAFTITMLMAVILYFYSTKTAPEDFSLLPRILSMLPTLMLGCTAAVRTFGRFSH